MDDESDNQEKEYERDGAQTDEEEEFVEQKSQPAIKCKIEGREGTYKEAVTAMDKYVMRPKILEFAISYVHANGVSNEILVRVFSIPTLNYPNIFHLKHQEMERLRSFPAVMRIHSSKKKEGHEQHYSELLLRRLFIMVKAPQY